MRYTEARLTKVAGELLEDIDKETVEFQDHLYDGATQSPGPAGRFPNLLVNGSGGIAVGMATNIPPPQSDRSGRWLHRADGEPGESSCRS